MKMKLLGKIIVLYFLSIFFAVSPSYANHCGAGPTLDGYNKLELKSIFCSNGGVHIFALRQKNMSEPVVGYQAFIRYSVQETEVLGIDLTSHYALAIISDIREEGEGSPYGWIEIAAGRDPAHQDPTDQDALLAVITVSSLAPSTPVLEIRSHEDSLLDPPPYPTTMFASIEGGVHPVCPTLVNQIECSIPTVGRRGRRVFRANRSQTQP